jgi:hypothetical protein
MKLQKRFVLIWALLSAFGCNRRSDHAVGVLTIQEIDSPAAARSGEPNLFAARDGKIYLSWIEQAPDRRPGLSRLRFAVRQPNGWSPPQTIAEGNEWFVNWADFPSLTALNDKSLLAHWLAKSANEKYAYDVKLALSNDGGKSWSEPIVPHRDKTATEHGFVSLLPRQDDRFLAVWLDGRNFSSSSEGNAGHGKPTNDMMLMATMIDTTGQLFEERLLDPRVCECCQTSAALTADGAVIVYRDRSPQEIRDISIIRYHRGRWLAPKSVHDDGWRIDGCPVNGPAVDAMGQRVVVAWYTGANETSSVKVVFSQDGGESFGQPVQVDDGNPIGRVDVILLPDGAALVSWLEQIGEAGEIRARRISPRGDRGTAMTISKTSTQRASGFPRLARNEEEIIFAWTDAGDPSQVRTAVAKIVGEN